MTTEELLQQLSDTSNALWEASMAQNNIELIQWGAGVAIVGVVWAVSLKTFLWTKKRSEEDDFSDAIFPGIIAFGIMSFVLLLVVLLAVDSAIGIIGNPEWAAASRIMSKLGGVE